MQEVGASGQRWKVGAKLSEVLMADNWKECGIQELGHQSASC